MACISGIPSTTLSSPYDSHARSSASDHLNQFSHLVMHAITSCHIKKRWKISVHFCRNALPVVFAVNVCARGLWCCNEFTLGICDARAFLRAGKHARNAQEIQRRRRLSQRPCVLNFKMKRICALVFFIMNPFFPCTCPVPLHTDDKAMIWVNLKVNTAHLELVALFSSSSQMRDVVQLSFSPLR